MTQGVRTLIPNNMKFVSITALILAFCAAAFAQAPATTIATANGQKFTAADLPEDVRDAFTKLPQTIASNRSALLEGALAQSLADAEAAARGVGGDKLFDEEVTSRVPNPTDQEMKAFYDNNQAALGGTPFETLKPRIFAYMRQLAEVNVQKTFVEALKAKYKPVMGKDVNAAALKPIDVLYTVQGKTLTVKEFEERFKGDLYEAEAEIYDVLKEALEFTVFEALLAVEAKAQNITAGDLIAKEITDKLKEFTPEERAGFELALRKTLFAKYKAQFSLKMPTPPVYNVATTDDPSTGPAAAPVTIVMFSDFQCPSCSAAHPVLKKILNEYAPKIRLIVRDYPLESIHANSFGAAVAAGAAAKQGKFFEYIELLYSNQNALDRDSLRSYAQKLGLDMTRFEVDLSDPSAIEEIRKDQADGFAAGVSGTPTLFINGVKLRDGSEEGLREAIENAIPKNARTPAK